MTLIPIAGSPATPGRGIRLPNGKIMRSVGAPVAGTDTPPPAAIRATGFKVVVSPNNTRINQSANVLIVARNAGSEWAAGEVAQLTVQGLVGSLDRTTVPLSGTSSGLAMFTATAAGTGTINATVGTLANMSVLAERTLTVAAAAAAGAIPPAVSENTFYLKNWNTTGSSPTFHRGGVFFYDGQVGPSDSARIERMDTPGVAVPAQFDARAYRDTNGSLFFSVVSLRDTDLTPGERRGYRIVNVSGVPFNNDNTKTPADLTAAGDFTIQATGLTETGDSGTTGVGSGSFTSSAAATLAVPTRTEVVASGPVSKGWTGWAMFKDDAGGAADAHLKSYWHGDVWLNADGTIYAREIASEPAQDWWSIPNKKLRTYTATLRQGGTTIQTYSNVAHHYRGHWLACQMTGRNRGKAHWIGGPQPTITYEYNKAWWVECKGIPPYHPTRQPNAQYNNAQYTPMGAIDHRDNIDGTGAYMGRGMLPNCDAVAHMLQTADSVAGARVNAHSGLHVHYHYRSNRQRIRPGDAGPDIASTVISLYMAVTGGGPAFDFTADGMPVPVIASEDSRVTNPDWIDGYTRPQGGTGVWTTTTGDPSHAVNYSAYMYALEGKRYHLEAQCDLATAIHHHAPFPNNGVSNANPLGPSDAALYYDGMAYLQGQERNLAFALAILGVGAAYIPNSHVAARFMRRYNHQQGLFLAKSVDLFPPDVIASGISGIHDEGGVLSRWQTAMNVQGLYFNFGLTQDPGILKYAEFQTNCSINQLETGAYNLGDYRSMFKPFNTRRRVPDNLFLKRARNCTFDQLLISGATGRVTLRLGLISDGDEIWVQVVDGDGRPHNLPMPPELAEGVAYYAVEASETSCRLARTPGGTPINFGADRPIWLNAITIDADAYIVALPGAIPNVDDPQSMHCAALTMAHLGGHPRVTQEVVDKVQLWMGPVDRANYVAWDMAEPVGPIQGNGAVTLINVEPTYRAGSLLQRVTYTGGAGGYFVLHRNGADEGDRFLQSLLPGNLMLLAPQNAGSYTIRVYTAATGGSVLFETAPFTVTASTGPLPTRPVQQPDTGASSSGVTSNWTATAPRYRLLARGELGQPFGALVIKKVLTNRLVFTGRPANSTLRSIVIPENEHGFGPPSQTILSSVGA